MKCISSKSIFNDKLEFITCRIYEYYFLRGFAHEIYYRVQSKKRQNSRENLTALIGTCISASRSLELQEDVIARSWPLLPLRYW